jgi:putative nucleotidyltransferase with HDIG domain
MTTAVDILKRIGDVPAMPPSAAEVLRVVQDPRADASRIMKAIQHDPGLTANVLRLANSAAFGGGNRIGSLQEAVVRIGARRIVRLVMASAVGPVASRAVRGYDLEPGRLWEHSIGVALATEALAKVMGRAAPDWAFTAGLLHDIGKIVLGTFVEIDAKPILAMAYELHVPFDESERRLLGLDHAETGAAVLEGWKLPPEIVQAVRWHHRPDEAGEARLCADWIHCADVLCMSQGLGAGMDGLNYRLSAAAAKRLGVNGKVGEAALCQVLAELTEVRQLFGNA